jgi:hypothetical protein
LRETVNQRLEDMTKHISEERQAKQQQQEELFKKIKGELFTSLAENFRRVEGELHTLKHTKSTYEEQLQSLLAQ